MTINERIRILLKSTGITYKKLAEEMGYTPQYVSALTIGKEIGLEPIHRLSLYFPNLNVKWLMWEEGEMFNDVNIVAEKQADYGKPSSNNAIELLALQLEKKDKQIDKLLELLNKK